MNAIEAKLQTAAPQIAKALGKGWKVDPRVRDYSHYVEIHGPEGAKLGISVNRKDGRFGISGCYDNRDNRGRQVSAVIPHKEENPSITVAADKAPKAIAGDITKRLLPKYLGYLKATQERVAQYNAQNDASLETARQIADVIGATVDTTADEPRLDLYRSKKLPQEIGELTCGAGTVRFDRIEVTTAEAAAMLRALVFTRAQNSADARVENHGSLFLIRPVTPAATEWLREHVSAESQWHGDALAVEPRYVEDLVAGMRDDGGLTVV